MTNENPQADRLRVKLEQGAQQLSLPLSSLHVDSLIQFLLLLNKWNRVHNLTAVRSIDDMVGRHILDSLSVLHWLPTIDEAVQLDSKLVNVLDVGSGGGLPVLPLAIVRPDLRFLSVESNGKKTRFQQQAVMELGLKNVCVQQVRIEDTNEQAHLVISRAFTAPDKFLQAVDKNCVASSKVVIMLGQKELVQEDLPAQFSLVETKKVDVPQFDSIRHVAVCVKSSSA